MNDRNVLIGTILFVLFFLLTGILGILDNPVTKGVLIAVFLAIVANIIYTKTQDKSE